MLTYALLMAMLLIVVAICLNVIALVQRPETPDRLLVLDTMYINAIALLLLYGIYSATALYFEVALLIAMLGFVSTVAICKFMLRGDIIE
jgi:multicomponent K+:H+ antiporter subunit F